MEPKRPVRPVLGKPGGDVRGNAASAPRLPDNGQPLPWIGFGEEARERAAQPDRLDVQRPGEERALATLAEQFRILAEREPTLNQLEDELAVIDWTEQAPTPRQAAAFNRLLHVVGPKASNDDPLIRTGTASDSASSYLTETAQHVVGAHHAAGHGPHLTMPGVEGEQQVGDNLNEPELSKRQEATVGEASLSPEFDERF